MNLSSLKALVNNPELWTSFCDYIEYIKSAKYTELENATRTEDIFRLQGELRMTTSFLRLKEKVRNAEPPKPPRN